MGFTEVLTIVFVILKLCGVISWGWFYVLLPEIIGLGLYVLLAIWHVALTVKINRKFDREFRRF